jgi:hypothetical protein
VRRAAGPVAVAVAATVPTSFLAAGRGSAGWAVVLYVSCLVGCVSWWLLQGVRPEGDAPRELMRSALTPGPSAPGADRPADLIRLQGLIASSRGSALDAQARLRPHLRELAASLLASRRGAVLDPARDDIATALGAPGEPLLARGADRLPPITERGPPVEDISRVVALLERI